VSEGVSITMRRHYNKMSEKELEAVVQAVVDLIICYVKAEGTSARPSGVGSEISSEGRLERTSRTRGKSVMKMSEDHVIARRSRSRRLPNTGRGRKDATNGVPEQV